LGLVVSIALLAMAIFANQLAPYSSAAIDITHRLHGPSPRHLLGTDNLGRDILSRLIIGTRIAFTVAFPAVLLAAILGLAFGLASAYAARMLGGAIVLAVEVLQALPAVVLALTLLAMYGPSLLNLILVIAVAFAPKYALVVRAMAISMKAEMFVRAEQALGAGAARIIGVHVVPNVLPTFVVMVAMDLPSAISIEAGLSFLGLGVQPPTPSWGVMLSEGFSRARESPWPVLWVSLMLMITTIGITFLGETLRDILDPKHERQP
jgi:peptide/nickel transport system permease protein